MARRQIRIAGRAEVFDGDGEAHIDKLAKKYIGEDSYPWRAPGDERVLIRIKPERVRTYNVD